MNAKITDAKVVPILYGKYKTDLFVFINQLDIKASGSKGPAELGEGNGNRKITVHYTVYTYDAKEINSGVAEEEFAVDLNNPKKIIEKHFSKIASTIVQRVNKGLAAPVK
jgi:ribosomal protein L14E/L6E/L27E